jgi:hypothetical protein
LCDDIQVLQRTCILTANNDIVIEGRNAILVSGGKLCRLLSSKISCQSLSPPAQLETVASITSFTGVVTSAAAAGTALSERGRKTARSAAAAIFCMIGIRNRQRSMRATLAASVALAMVHPAKANLVMRRM